MTMYERSVEVAVPADKAYHLLADSRYTSDYIPEITSAEDGTEGDVQLYTSVGAKLTQVRVWADRDPLTRTIAWRVEGAEAYRGVITVTPLDTVGTLGPQCVVNVVVDDRAVEPQEDPTEGQEARIAGFTRGGGQVPTGEPHGIWLGADAHRFGPEGLLDRLLNDFREYAETGKRAAGRPR